MRAREAVKKCKMLLIMSKEKSERENRCRGNSADTNLKSSRHSTCVEERGGRGKRRTRRGGGREGWRRKGVILLIREVGAYSAVRTNFQLSE